jgi:nitrogen-specific signal transduction histidine kinase
MEHKGALDVKSTSEEGTLFSVYFPVYSFNEISEGKIKV